MYIEKLYSLKDGYWILAVTIPICIVFLITRFYKEQAFGGGDYLIIISIVLLLESKEIFVAMESSVILAAFVGVLFTMLSKQKLNKTIIPLVPFLFLGLLIALNWTSEIWDFFFVY